MSNLQPLILDFGESIPNYIKRLPINLQMGWKSAYNLASDMYGFDKGLRIANSWLLNKMEELEVVPQEDFLEEEVKQAVLSKELKGIEVIAESNESLGTFKLDPQNEEMISYSDQGDIVIEAVLADDNFSSDGKRFTKAALISMAGKINDNGLYLPDIEHADYNKILCDSTNYSDFKNKLKAQKGLLTKVKAFYQDGKLLIKAWLDKRYKKHVDVYKSLSIEAKGTYENNDPSVYVDAEPLSFTFTNTPKLKGANVLAVA